VPPLIGLSTYREQARWGVWDQPANLLPTLYADAICAAGGVPLLLPPQDTAGADAVVRRLDGLVITGGADIDPGRYGAEAHPRTVSWRTDRDAWELALLDAADQHGTPVLGICRGMQLMAVHGGGSLRQLVGDRTAVGCHHHQSVAEHPGFTAAAYAEDGTLEAIEGADDRFRVAVQWHPETRADAGLFAGLVTAATRPGM
jgi:putative glutamine amidotransferase